MKKVIRGRRYDTGTAEKIGAAYSECEKMDFAYWEEELYRKNTGEFFLYGWGRPLSRYGVTDGNNTSGSEVIRPLSVEDAQSWAGKNLDGKKYEEIFGPVEETNEKKTVLFSLPLDAVEHIKRRAAARGISMSEYVTRLIKSDS